MKTCFRCKEGKDSSLFTPVKQNKDGLHSYCRACVNEKAREKFAKLDDLTAHRARVARWRKNNPESAREHDRRDRERNRDRRNAYSREYRKKNPEKMAALGAAWAKNNPEVCREIIARRRAAKKSATPSWAADEFEQLFVKEAYHLAMLRTKLTGIQWHVDHIVPLKSKRVCGLHCMANMQVITASANHAKNNYVWPDMAEWSGR